MYDLSHTQRPQSGWKSWLAGLATIDPRSLAACRVALGSLLLFDILCRLTDLQAMYLDDGLMPAAQIREYYANSWRWSLQWWDGSLPFQLAVFLLTAIFAVALLMGYQTRLATIGCWILCVSLHTRAPLVINAGDSLLRTLLFWGMFLPWGRAWSVDAWRRGSIAAPTSQPVVSIGTAAILLQVCVVYWFTAVYKLLTESWQRGAGLQNALNWGGYNKPLGIWLLQHTTLNQLLSYGTIALEFIGPVVLLLAWRRPLLRTVGIAAFVAFHVGIELCMYVGLFSYVSIAAWTLFLPRQFWERVLREPSGQMHTDVAEPRAIGRLDRWAGILSSALCLTLLSFMLSYNVIGLAARWRGTKIPGPLRRIADVTLLRQKWAMFAKPSLTSNWFAAKARLKNGEVVDVLRDGRPFDIERPPRLALLYPNHHWRKFVMALTVRPTRYQAFSQNLSDYLFRQWNASHGPEEQIVLLELMCVYEKAGGNDPTGEFASRVHARTESEDVSIEETIGLPFELQE